MADPQQGIRAVSTRYTKPRKQSNNDFISTCTNLYWIKKGDGWGWQWSARPPCRNSTAISSLQCRCSWGETACDDAENILMTSTSTIRSDICREGPSLRVPPASPQESMGQARPRSQKCHYPRPEAAGDTVDRQGWGHWHVYQCTWMAILHGCMRTRGLPRHRLTVALVAAYLLSRTQVIADFRRSDQIVMDLHEKSEESHMLITPRQWGLKDTAFLPAQLVVWEVSAVFSRSNNLITSIIFKNLWLITQKCMMPQKQRFKISKDKSLK